MEVETRWNSTCCMFERLIKLEWTMRRVLSNPEVISPTDARHLHMSDANWALMKALVPLLQPMKKITDLLQETNYPTIALIYLSLIIFKNTLDLNETDIAAVAAFKTEIMQRLNTMYFSVGYHRYMPILA